AFGDIDNDGDQDVFEEMGGAYSGDNYPSVLYENPGNGNNWIKLKLEGLQSNRSAIGARIKVTAETPNGERSIYRTVGTGGSFGCSPLRQEIGLGNATAIKSVRIDWPTTGKHQIFTNVAVNQMVKIREGEPTTASVQLKSFKLASGAGGHHHGHKHH
ncbi:MAG TPA: ASPIC/UnbV domain-containing protein, partial [Verrucomicrobiae bacterium]|nr:ASPIC/UnbV domain-containing protein [Verrucomicrobiae bacterium]